MRRNLACVAVIIYTMTVRLACGLNSRPA